ncbi:MAG TPA: glycosyltransferase family 4 protein [Gaiellaceae bacterium]|jgi:phosphatidylinositol alpha-mannosyltransferase|nr:glycosyltransferase family 4 protein [Gaiellaceae bacterium]
MKVGIVVPYSWSFWGGVQEHADHQARALRDLGVEAKILMGHDPPGRLTKLLHPKEGRHTRPPDYVIPVGRSVIVPANASLPNIILSPPAMLRMRRIFAEERFDVVHVHEPYAPILSAFALVAAPCPTVATFHAAGEKLGWYPMGRRMWGIAVDRADYRIAVSESARRAAEPYAGGPLEVIPNGIFLPETFDPGGRNGNVVFIGRNERRKGLEVLLRAWPGVAAKTEARLRVVGADPLSVRWLARRQGLSLERVDLLGGLSEENLTSELQAASLLAAPALGGESFGMVLTRAFATATPAVASDIEGYAAVADQTSAVLVPPGDSAAVVRALVQLLTDEPRRAALGAGARTVAEQYSWDRIARRLVEIYEQLTVGTTAQKAAA